MRQTLLVTATIVLLAGLAGGIAEIAWVLAYGAFAGVSAADVAREVTASVFPGAANAPAGLALGIGIHLALSIALAFAFVALLQDFLQDGAGTIAIALGALAGVWAVNFLVVLPLVNPRFVTLMPYAATFLSKALFGAAMGTVLARNAPRPSCFPECRFGRS